MRLCVYGEITFSLPCMVLKLKTRIRSIHARRMHIVFYVYTYIDPFFLNQSINYYQNSWNQQETQIHHTRTLIIVTGLQSPTT